MSREDLGSLTRSATEPSGRGKASGFFYLQGASVISSQAEWKIKKSSGTALLKEVVEEIRRDEEL